MNRPGIYKAIFGVAALASLALAPPRGAEAATMNDYCVAPAFLSQNTVPNLLLMIDNSASMYDLAYQDTGTTYCANAPTTSCTPGTTCSGTAYCTGSYATTPATTVAASCNSNADCAAIVPGDTCVLTGPKSGRNLCNRATVSVPASVAPISCSTDSQCTSSGGSCPAGTTCTWTSYDTCNNKCNATRQCYDATYNAGNTYVGYFTPSTTYGYDFSNGKFTSGVSWPSSCTYSASGGSPSATYVCVNTTGSGSTEAVVTTGNGFVASGNFLNWLAASKFDQEKSVLTGGKYDSINSLLLGESRGCAGRKFVKTLPGVDLTFAVRGGSPTGISSTESLATEYGQTYIDLYTGTYNSSSCLAAMYDWMNVNSVNLGSFQNDTKGCVGAGNGTLNGISMWNHILHNCYQGMTGGAQGYSTNLGPLEGECQAIYTTVPPSQIDQNSGAAVCAGGITYSVGGTSYTGYLGACWNGTNFNGPCTPNDLTQMQNFCQINVNTNPVVDPSSTTLTGSAASAPGFILEQGLMNTNLVGTLAVKIGLSSPPTGLINTFKNRIRFGAMAFNSNGSKSECGSGNIPCSRYCSVTTTRLCFQDSDCPSGETCPAYSSTNNRDGGQIISYVGAGQCSVTTSTSCKVNSDCPANEYCKPSVGDHNSYCSVTTSQVCNTDSWGSSGCPAGESCVSSGVIRAIDNIQATTWTPHAEGFYNAIAYFTKDATATTPALPTSFAPSTATSSAATPINAPLSTSDFLSQKNPIQYRCQQNNLLLVTDGASTADQNATMKTKVTDASGNFRDPSTTSESSVCGNYQGSPFLHDLSYYAYHRDIFDPTKACPAPAGSSYTCSAAQTLRTYVVYTGATSTSTDMCNAYAELNQTASDGGTTLYNAGSTAGLQTSLSQALQAVATGEASGTAASILSNSQGSGANILQAVFYPTKYFDNNTHVNWIGELQNLWYYIDPYLSQSTVREDTSYTGSGTHYLNLKTDYALNFFFDNQNPNSATYNQTMVNRSQDINGDGSVYVPVDTVTPDAVNSIWRAGKLLWSRTGSRTVYTPCLVNGTCLSNNLMSFSTANAAALQPALQAAASPSSESSNLINWVLGTDQSGYRSRTVTIGSSSGVWKLGDIVSSTPRLQSSVELNSYDLGAPVGYNDLSYTAYIGTSNYANRGMVYVGANDGMLHAFKLGTLNVTPSGFQKASLSGTSLGQEEWAFIPSQTLPYLRYLTCAQGNGDAFCAGSDYGHLYYVDGTTTVVDASIGNTATCPGNYWDCTKDNTAGSNWRTVLIGSMGVGGASRDNTSACADDVSGTCVKSPVAGMGYSSYFALDITNQTYDGSGNLAGNPTLMWEFSDPDGLGFATTGAATVRIKSRNASNAPVATTNGRWFAVFGSGPTGPIDKSLHRFMGTSNQPIKIYVVDLNARPPFVLNTNYWVISSLSDGSTIQNAFVSSMSGATIDADRMNTQAAGNYQDDALYFGYVEKGTGTPWGSGGVLRLMTHEDPNPANWTLSKVISGIGPVTTGIARLQNTKTHALWLYFGTGRYYYSQDDMADRQTLFGISEPCYTASNTLDPTCTTSVPPPSGFASTLTNQTSAGSTTVSSSGWYINLDAQDTTNALGAERVVTDPVALTNGAVFFTTFKPSADLCNFGGNSYLWATNYSTGLAPPTAALQGKALLQVSTGAFQQIDLSTAFTANSGRKMFTAITGKPPSDAPPIVTKSNLKPVKRILQIREH